eukprot:COSAG06_NODE_98_length_24155_cov_29.681784_5_plen_528_part_00
MIKGQILIVLDLNKNLRRGARMDRSARPGPAQHPACAAAAHDAVVVVMMPEPEPEPEQRCSSLSRRRQRLLDELGRSAPDDVAFAEFLRCAHSSLQRDDDGDSDAAVPVVVVDAGRLRWAWGRAGESSPAVSAHSDHTLQGQAAGDVGDAVSADLGRLRSGSSSESDRAPRRRALLRQHRAASYTHFLEWVSKERAARTSAWAKRVAMPDGPRRAPPLWPTLAVVTVPLLESAADEHPQWLLTRLFSDLPMLRGVALQNQETFAAHACARPTALVVNLGCELSLVGFHEGTQLSQTARVLRTPCYDLWPLTSIEAATEWLHASSLLAALRESLAAAPADVREALSQNVVIAGGKRNEGAAGQPNIDILIPEALRHASSFRWRVSSPPERSISAWVGGSIFATEPATFDNPGDSDGAAPYFISRRRFELCTAMLAAPSSAMAAGGLAGVTEAVDRLLGRSAQDLCKASMQDRAKRPRQVLAWARCLLMVPCDELSDNVTGPLTRGLAEELVRLVAARLPYPRAEVGAA